MLRKWKFCIIFFSCWCSDEGVVDCVQTIKKDETYFTTVLNIGSVDYANYYRFSCLVSLPNKIIQIGCFLLYCDFVIVLFFLLLTWFFRLSLSRMGWYIWVIVKEAVKQIKRQQSNSQTEVVPLCLLNKVLFYFKATMKFFIFQIESL